VSGPVGTADAPPDAVEPGPATPATLEVWDARQADVGGMAVRRSLPKRTHRTVGAWCFADHFGPADVAAASMQIGPHPHIGLQTVTWLLDGEVVHRDSLGSEQPIRPGQLNLMTAGRGVAHAEETAVRTLGSLHGVQLWVALPDATRNGDAAFEHHAELPRVDLGEGVATVLVGRLGDAGSPARTDTPLVGVELDVAGRAALPLDPAFEHGLLVADGELAVDGTALQPGRFAYLGLGRDELAVTGRGRALLLGGAPFDETILMWWNFVARSRDEVDAAFADWQAADGRFGDVRSTLPRIPAPRPSWLGV
jgi:redox-sensitive bicupin YhaK (pirin superfamily)